MDVLSLFSGIGAFEKSLTNIGEDFNLVGFSEIDKWAIESYCAIHGVDKSLNLGDISRIGSWELPKNTDILTYGFPCQDISVAGRLEGIEEDTRSGLLYEAERIIKNTKPKVAIAENVKNLISKRFNEDFKDLLKRLEDYGYNNYWKVLNAKDYNVPQQRERVFIVSIRKDIDNDLFEFPEIMDLKIRLKDVLDEEFEDKYIIDNDKSKNLLQILKSKDLLNGNRFCTDSTINDPQKREISNCITSRYDAGIQNQKQIGLVVVEPKRIGGLYDTEKHKRQAGAIWDKDHLAPTISTCQGGNREPLVVVREATKKEYDVAKEGDSINLSFPNSKTRRGRVGKGVAQTLDTTCNQGVLDGYVIRKLTPLECWRLMGFDDEDYWKARNRLEEVFYNGNDRSNSQMYKQAGNSIVVDVLEGIFKNLMKVLKPSN